MEKRDRSTSDTAHTRRTRQTFDALQAGDRRLSATTHFEDRYDAFPAGSPPWLGERAAEFGDTAVWVTALSVSRVKLRSTSIFNRCSLLIGNGIRRIFNGRAACVMRSCGMEVDLVEFACLMFANHYDSRISQNRLHDQKRVRLREIDHVGEPLHCSLADTTLSGTELCLN